MKRRVWPAAAVLAAATIARADDPASAPPTDDQHPRVEGSVRFGWRLISGEGEGRYPQEYGLKDGPRLFDLDLSIIDPRPNRAIDEADVRLSGIGDPNTDCLVDLRKSGLFDVSGGFRRDDYSYRAGGDPFAYDTIREHTFVHGRFTPDADLAIRFSWDRDRRHGDAYTSAYVDLLPPPTNSDGPVAQHRPLSNQHDDFTLGADWAIGGLRFGLTESARLANVDDRRFYDAKEPAGADPVSQALHRRVRSTAFTTAAKVGAEFFDRALDVNLFVTHTHLPTHSAIGARTEGYDGGKIDGTNPNGAYVQKTSADTRVHRDSNDVRLEGIWRPRSDVEVVASGEIDDSIDHETFRYRTVRDFARPELDPVTKNSAWEPDVPNRNDRWSIDGTWRVTDNVRARLGEQFLRQDLYAPTETHFIFEPPFVRPGVFHSDASYTDALAPRTLVSDTWRTTAGLDCDPTKRVSVGVLAHFSTNDAPATTPVPHRSDDFTLRTRWKPRDDLVLTAHWRHTDGSNKAGVPYDPTAMHPALGDVAQLSLHDRFLHSTSREDEASLSGAFDRGPWNVSTTVTYQAIATQSETSLFRGTTYRFPTVGFESHDVVANADVRYAVTKSLRLHAGATRTTSRGDFPATWLQLAAGAEYDLPMLKHVALGLDVLSWRLREKDAPHDGYSTQAVEASITYKF